MRPRFRPTPAANARRRRRRRLPVARALAAAVLAAPLSAAVVGCDSKSWIDPGELVDPDKANQLQADGRARPRVQAILSELDLGVTRTPDAFGNARDVQARDLEVQAQDYRMLAGDVIRVSIPELRPGQAGYLEPIQISQTGRITLPDLPNQQVTVAGLTDTEAAAAIQDAYVQAGIFVQPPNVSVLVVTPNGQTFKITGNVGAPGRYPLARPDYRLMDALTDARALVDPDYNAEWVYVIRNTARTAARPTQPQDNAPLNPNRGGQGAGQGRQGDPLRPGASADPAPGGSDAVFATVAQNQPAGSNQGGTQGGQGFQFQAPQEPADTEVIRVPVRDLLGGQLKYNMVVRPEDTIIVQPPETGVIHVGGHALVQGAFQILPGQRLTVKQAIISARGLDEVAIPSRTQLIRRVDDQDVFVRIDLAKIFVGEEPDIYMQPNDIIMVGTNLPAPFIAAFRNAFRVTYGFGFLYDRNFAVDRNNQRF